MRGEIFDIQRFSIHDGPGIRTTVFLKGCSLHCRWCCNPESIAPQPVLLFNPELCIGCGKCAEVCPSGASAPGGRLNRAKCTSCGKCAEVCYAEARYMKGKSMSAEDLLREICRDESFYRRTGGGVSFSGGEPLLQIDFLEEMLTLCRARGIGTAIETCGNVPWENFARIAGLVDVFLFDIKNTDSEKHREYTGGSCERILENCRRLAGIAKRLVIRVPVIPEFNFDLETLTRTVRFAEEIGVNEVNFLPYHRFAAAKYAFMGLEYWNPGVERLDERSVAECIGRIDTPIKLQIGG